MSTPTTQVNICSGVRLDNRYLHTIYFASQEAQQEYFAGKVVRTFPAYSHHRRNWELKVEATVEVAQRWNYLYIVNPGVKPYYYFINKVEYVSDTTVKLFLELDVIQTNLFNMDLLPCFVERQHTETDEIGEHTIPEGLEIGPYWNYHVYNMEDMAEMGILAMSSMNLCFNFTDGAVTETAYAQEFNGVYSGLGVYAFDDLEKLEAQLKALDEAGKADAVTAIWMYPKNLVTVAKYTGEDESAWADFDFSSKVCARVMAANSDPATLALYTNYSGNLFEGYTPKNKKLYTSPYNLLYVTSNQGDKAEYKFEYFTTPDDVYNFHLYGAISPDAGVKLAPDRYNIPGANVNYDEGITLGNFPPCAWDSDTYKVWLAQNYNQMNHGIDSAVSSALLGVGMTVAGAVATVATGGMGAVAGVGAIGAGVSSLYNSYTQIGGILAQKEDAKAQPPQAKGTFSSTVNVASGRQTFTFYYKCIRKEYAKQIDDYFTMYGYKVNRVQRPNINARPAFTFVKTIGCKVWGNLCNEDIVNIERIFDNGVTFWKDGDNIGNYTLDNAV